jgi:hypothetical protein
MSSLPISDPIGPAPDALLLVSVLAAYRRIGAPLAVSGATLAAFRGWPRCVPPRIPQFVSPTTRRDVDPTVANVRRVKDWQRLALEAGPYGVPLLSVLDGMITLAPDVDDPTFHTILQGLVFNGELSFPQLMARRRTGLPGSARISRVGGHYGMGLDSPGELRVFNLFRFHGCAPDHLNALVRTPQGLAGPYDGLDDIGCAYEYDGADHTDDDHQVTDPWKDERAAAAGVELVRLLAPDVHARVPAVEGWLGARATAAQVVRPAPLEIVHLPGRSCPCGHRPG